MGFRKYELGSYEEMCAAHSWEVPERYNIARDVCDKHDRDRLAMVWEDWRGEERRVSFGELQDLSNRFANALRGDRRGARGPRRDAAAVAAGDRRRLPRHLQARRDPAVAVGAVRRRGHRAPAARLAGQGGGHRLRQPPPHPGGDGREGAGDGRPRRGRRRRLRRDDGARLRQLRGGRHRRRRPRPALLLVRHDRARRRASCTRTATCSPTRSSSSATTCATASCSTARASGPGPPGICPLLGPWRYGAVALVQARKGGYDPEEHLALPVQARRAEHVHHADRAARDDGRGGRGRALPAAASCG